MRAELKAWVREGERVRAEESEIWTGTPQLTFTPAGRRRRRIFEQRQQ